MPRALNHTNEPLNRSALSSNDPRVEDNAFSDPQRSPLRSLVTNTVSEILERLGISLLASTYQAGNVVVLRSESPQVLNTHFRRFPRPMGMAADPETGRLALGTDREIVEFRNMVAVSLLPVTSQNETTNGTVRFEGTYRMEGAGHFAHGLRVRARHGTDPSGTLKDLVFWA